jgi:hypothetical protein
MPYEQMARCRGFRRIEAYGPRSRLRRQSFGRALTERCFAPKREKPLTRRTVELGVIPREKMSPCVKGFGRRPIATVGEAPGPSSESPQGRNPRGVEVGKAPRAMAI